MLSIDMAMLMAHTDSMRTNVADLKNHISYYLSLAEKGEVVEVCKRNIPMALIIPVQKTKINRTVLGLGKGSVVERCDLTEPMISTDDWNMLHSQDL
ncbi:MAG: type II toxin-antitoxin system prevent-host-death family antitoxin [Nitrospirae bacterium]|nr:type II toxin-antitoxin system prevent-host-death family antitoxin [Nitrospirota bacterium]